MGLERLNALETVHSVKCIRNIKIYTIIGYIARLFDNVVVNPIILQTGRVDRNITINE